MSTIDSTIRSRGSSGVGEQIAGPTSTFTTTGRNTAPSWRRWWSVTAAGSSLRRSSSATRCELTACQSCCPGRRATPESRAVRTGVAGSGQAQGRRRRRSSRPAEAPGGRRRGLLLLGLRQSGEAPAAPAPKPGLPSGERRTDHPIDRGGVGGTPQSRRSSKSSSSAQRRIGRTIATMTCTPARRRTRASA